MVLPCHGPFQVPAPGTTAAVATQNRTYSLRIVSWICQLPCQPRGKTAVSPGPMSCGWPSSGVTVIRPDRMCTASLVSRVQWEGPRRALPHPHLLIAVGPQRPARGLHRLPRGLGQRAPVLQVGGGRRGGQERGGRGRVGHGTVHRPFGKGSARSGRGQLVPSACSGASSGNGS